MSTRGGAVHVAVTRRHYKDRVYETTLLRRSYREDGKVRTETVGNLSHLPPELIELVRRGLAGERFVAASGLEIRRSVPAGHVAAVLGVARALGLERLLDPRRSRERDLVLGMVVARVLAPASKLATARSLDATTLGATLGIGGAGEDELYAALDWLGARQARIERRLAARHLAPGGSVYVDLSSSVVTGRHNPLAAIGYSRDGKQGTLQIEYALLTDPDGRPVAVSVVPGNTADPSTMPATLATLRERFGLASVVLVGDRGMLTSARIETLRVAGFDWVSALRGPAIARLAADGALQLGLFDERDLAEISHPDFPGERLVVCRNPALAAERARKRADLLAATETALAKVAARVEAGRLRGAARIGLATGRVVDRHKMAKHLALEITDDRLVFSRREDEIAAEAALDGLYVLRTSVPAERLPAPDVVRAYKRLARVERAFRTLKSPDLAIRPIHHWTEGRVRAHVFLCLLAYYLRWHLERAWAPLLFRDEEPPVTDDPVAPARRSEVALAKASRHALPDGTPAHSFRTLLAELATLTRNTVVLPGTTDEAAIEILATPTQLQARAFALLGLSPAGT
jgi:Transposase DDE domain